MTTPTTDWCERNGFDLNQSPTVEMGLLYTIYISRLCLRNSNLDYEGRVEEYKYERHRERDPNEPTFQGSHPELDVELHDLWRRNIADAEIALAALLAHKHRSGS